MAESSQLQTQIPRIFTPIDMTELDPEDRNCNICQEPMEERSEKPIRLPCTHTFGKRCITQWLLENDSCPQCRRITLTQPQPQVQSQTPAPRAGQSPQIPAYLAILTHDLQSKFAECWREMRARLLYRLRENRFTPVAKATAFVEDQTSADIIPGMWTFHYCAAIQRTPQALINGECTAWLESDEVLVRSMEQELNEVGMEEAAEEQSRDFDHLARVLREHYIED